MAEFIQNDPDKKGSDLKSADAEKSDGGAGENQSAQETFGGRLIGSPISSRYNKDNRRKNLPIIADVVIGVIILALFAGIVVGAYFLFRYFSNDYHGVEISYTMVVPCDNDMSNLRTLKGDELYLDTEDNTYYFGTVSDVLLVENKEKGNYAVIVVEMTVKFNEGEGYSISKNRIAVGCQYGLRSESGYLSGTIVELSETVSGGE